MWVAGLPLPKQSIQLLQPISGAAVDAKQKPRVETVEASDGESENDDAELFIGTLSIGGLKTRLQPQNRCRF